MGTSRLEQIPQVLQSVISYKPQSVLDVGVGCGKYGLLLREYLEGWEKSPSQILCAGQRTLRVDGVEVFPEAITPVHKLLYDNIIVGDIANVCHDIGDYDVIMMIDVIEHLEKSVAMKTLQTLLPKVKKGIIISTPADDMPQDPLYGNEHERHVSVWSPADFASLNHVQTMIHDEQLMVAISTGVTHNSAMYEWKVKSGVLWPVRRLWWSIQRKRH
jgi:SAM-dependent methyltransferase